MEVTRLAESLVNRRGSTLGLDYTPGSLARVGALAGVRGDDGLTLCIAAYYGEVVRRNLGQAWRTGRGHAFPRLHVGFGIELDPVETAERLLAGDADALQREYAELATALLRGEVEVYDDATWHLGEMGAGVPDRQAYVAAGLLVRWAAARGHLVDGLLQQVRAAQGSPGQVFERVLSGRLASDALTVDADRFFRAYASVGAGGVPGLGRWSDDLAALGGAYAVADDDDAAARVAVRLDQRWQAWHALGCPLPAGFDDFSDELGTLDALEAADASVGWGTDDPLHVPFFAPIPDGAFQLAVFEVPEPWPVHTLDLSDPAEAVRLSRVDRLFGLVPPGRAVPGQRVALAEYNEGPLSPTIQHRSRSAVVLGVAAPGTLWVQAHPDPEVDERVFDWLDQRGVPYDGIRRSEVADSVFWRGTPTPARIRDWMAVVDPAERLRLAMRWYDDAPRHLAPRAAM